jgi:hypothetical protein
VADDSDQRDLILILARDLTSRLATAAFVVDADGTLAYFNEAAEPVLGASYAETGELPAGGWASEWDPRNLDGTPVPLEALPLGIAFREGRPAHMPLCIRGGDGMDRTIEVTAFPAVRARRPDPRCDRDLLGTAVGVVGTDARDHLGLPRHARLARARDGSLRRTNVVHRYR